MNSKLTYTGNGTSKSFVAPDFNTELSTIKVYVDSVLQTSGYTYDIYTKQIIFTDAPANGTSIKLERETDIDSKVVDFTDRNILNGSDLNKANDQLFQKIQEIVDNPATSGGSSFSGSYNDLIDKPVIPDALSDLSADATHRTVTDSEKNTWNGKADTSHNHAIGDVTNLSTTLSGKADTSHNHDTAYEAKNSNIQSHISDTSNPHSTTANQVLPSQTGNSGKVLSTDGTNTSWTTPTGASYSSTTPLAGGTAAVGTEEAAARGDHVHPRCSGYALFFQCTNSSLTASTSYRFAGYAQTLNTDGQSQYVRVYIPKSGTIKSAYGVLKIAGTTAATGTITLNIDKNGSSLTEITNSLTASSVNNPISNGSLSLSVSAGDWINFQVVAGSLSSTATSVQFSISLYIEA